MGSLLERDQGRPVAVFGDDRRRKRQQVLYLPYGVHRCGYQERLKVAAPRFDDQPLSEIVARVRDLLAADGRAVIVVPHPDLAAGRYAGEVVETAAGPLVRRPLRSWLDLAERLGCRLTLPQADGALHVSLVFEPLGPEAPWHGRRRDDPERYGAGSAFRRVRKLEEPRFLLDYLEALERAAPPTSGRVLSLGVNAGEELAGFEMLDPEWARSLAFVGVDRAASSLELARDRFPSDRYAFVEADLEQLDALELGQFDLVLALGVLQSRGVDDRALLRSLVQRHLGPAGALVLSLPNGRYRDGELLYGARMRNFRQPELSLLVRDVAFYRRYLHQHRFQVFVTGKYDLLVTAIRSP